MATRRLNQIKPAASTDLDPLAKWIPQTSPELDEPTHLVEVTDAVELIGRAGETVRLAFSVPPRHWKSTTLHHAIVWLFKLKPGFRVLYLTYAQDFAERQSRAVMRIAQRAGFRFRRTTFAEWETDNGCVFRAAGIIGGATGEGFDLIIVDDPYRKRADAESRTIRRRTSESFFADVFTRQGNKPTSFIIVHTRWHVEDLIGEVTDPDWAGGNGFAWINLPAINAQGAALLPEYWPVERLQVFRSNPYEWASQYQGNPVPRGAEVFGPATYCTLADLPTSYQAGLGIDLAYTAKKSADYSVFVALRRHGDTTYVADVIRRQEQPDVFGKILARAQGAYPGLAARWYCSGTEKGVANLLPRVSNGSGQSIRIDAKNATTDKLMRATPVSVAWREGKILVPSDAPWAAEFIAEVSTFTGVGDEHDDQVDALAAAWDALEDASRTGHVGSSKPTASRRVARAFLDKY